LIITCDDFGIHEDIDSSIIHLCKKNKINAVSIISCGKTFSSSIKELLKFKGKVNIGIHSTWVGEESILSYQKIPSIVSKEKYFCNDFKRFYINWLIGKIDLDHLMAELEEQILRLLNIAGHIDHIDSHQHIHMIPKIFDRCIKLAEKYNISRIRVADESFSERLPRIFNPIKLGGEKLIKNWATKNKNILEDSSLKTTDKFFGIRYSGNFNLIDSYLIELLKEKKEDIEINFHPAFKTDSLLADYPWYQNGDIDYNILMNN